ncbi:MAG: glycosyltransferase family 4 protein [Ignavibacteria bacterium]
MIIAINCRNILPHKLEGFGRYSLELVRRICARHPEVTFVLFFDREVAGLPDFGPNTKQVVLHPPTRHTLLYTVWFDWVLPRALAKHKVDLFWSPDGFLSLRTSVPQVATIHDINFEHYPDDLPKRAGDYYRSHFPRFAHTARHIFTVSQFSKDDLVATYKLDPAQITVAYNGIGAGYVPLADNVKQQVRQQLTSGRPYFVFVGSVHPRKNVQRLVDAFATFCQHNQEIDLVIVGAPLWKGQSVTVPEQITGRVTFTGYLDQEELQHVTGAALALTYVPYFEGFGIPLAEAMACDVPILCSSSSCLPEVAGNAAIYCDPFSVEDIARGMQRMLDGELRAKLVANGRIQRTRYSWDVTADVIGRYLTEFTSR